MKKLWIACILLLPLMLAGCGAQTNQPAIETASGKRFHEGRYSDFIVDELIAYIDATYATLAAREGGTSAATR